MLKVGCTNLFQFNQSNVCKTEEKAKMVTKMAENLYKQQASFNLTQSKKIRSTVNHDTRLRDFCWSWQQPAHNLWAALKKFEHFSI